jgi:general stress protein YciG
MPKGPKGEKRPADVVGAAVKVMKIATGEIEEDIDDSGKSKAAVELGRRGGKARAKKMTPERRSEIAKKAAESRWLKSLAPSEED